MELPRGVPWLLFAVLSFAIWESLWKDCNHSSSLKIENFGATYWLCFQELDEEIDTTHQACVVSISSSKYEATFRRQLA